MFAVNQHCEQRVAHGVPLNLLAILCAMPSKKSDMSNSLAISSLFFALSILLTGTFYWFAATTQQDFVVAKRSHSLVAFFPRSATFLIVFFSRWRHSGLQVSKLRERLTYF